jgi:hypothetical protein
MASAVAIQANGKIVAAGEGYRPLLQGRRKVRPRPLPGRIAPDADNIVASRPDQNIDAAKTLSPLASRSPLKRSANRVPRTLPTEMRVSRPLAR